MDKFRLLIVCGSRDWPTPLEVGDYVRNWIHMVQADGFTPIIVSGGARGADTSASLAACGAQCAYLEVPAEWDRFGRSAGPMRNGTMLALAKSIPGLLTAVAFWHKASRGTGDMISRLRRANVAVEVIKEPS